ncbi:hypothetical protein L6452_35968 [Arctium lappa]|uniref:Uncharacterized protein n=1 Tax=Arctium lappa TaxID=4217 RepID=A0ACB8Y7Y1_ARCLA|nr:hypothetical protein L6452_35968 [Arctium lappa]
MSNSDEIIEQLFVDVSEFIIDELEDDTHEKMLKPVEKKFQRKKRYIQRGLEEGHNRLVADCFSDQPVFPPYIFRRSGWSDDQVKDAARKLYYSTYKKNFKYEHAWAIIKDEPKWRGGSINDVHTKRTKTDSSGSFTSSSDVKTSFKKEDDETRVRPMGKKGNKGRKKKNKASDTCTLAMESSNDVLCTSLILIALIFTK